MKLRVRDRLLSALMGLIILAGDAAGLCMVVQTNLSGWQFWAIIAACVVLAYIGLCGIAQLFRRRKEKGVVVQKSEFGDVSISMKAMENMVKKCVDAHPELKIEHTRISHNRLGVSVEMKITLATGVNIPLTVNALQKQVKQYITSCSGVDVEEVRVLVETEPAKNLPAPVQAPPAPVVEEPAVQPVAPVSEPEPTPEPVEETLPEEMGAAAAEESTVETIAEAVEETPQEPQENEENQQCEEAQIDG